MPLSVSTCRPALAAGCWISVAGEDRLTTEDGPGCSIARRWPRGTADRFALVLDMLPAV